MVAYVTMVLQVDKHFSQLNTFYFFIFKESRRNHEIKIFLINWIGWFVVRDDALIFRIAGTVSGTCLMAQFYTA